jgi:hypothetical protein
MGGKSRAEGGHPQNGQGNCLREGFVVVRQRPSRNEVALSRNRRFVQHATDDMQERRAMLTLPRFIDRTGNSLGVSGITWIALLQEPE